MPKRPSSDRCCCTSGSASPSLSPLAGLLRCGSESLLATTRHYFVEIKPRPAELVAYPRSTRLCARHFLVHVKYQFAISFFRLGQQTPKLAEITCIFARTTQAMSSDDFRFGRFGSSGGFSPS